MVTYIVDASAALRYLDSEEGAIRMGEIVAERLRGNARVLVSAIHWGESAGVLYKRHGPSEMHTALLRLAHLGFEVISASAEHAVRAALLKAELRIPYADASGVALAQQLDGAIFVSADWDFKSTEHLISTEFLLAKSRS